MNDQSESADSHWFGHDRLRLSDGERAVDVTIGSVDHWDRSHLRRLRQSGDLPGMVPVIDSDFSTDGRPFAVTPAIEAPSLAEMIAAGDLDWKSGAGIAEAAARAAHEAHLRGLFHGALSPQDVYVVDNDVAIGGVGLGLGGTPPEELAAWTAPEVRDGANPTERSDVFSLGKILEQSLGEALDTAPRSIRRLIMWSSSDTPEARPPSAMEFASILAEGLGDERRTYGPAFIATGEVSDLAAQAGLAVTRHTPVMVTAASDETSSAGAGVAGVAAGAAVSGLSDLGGTPDEPGIDDGFTVSESDGEAIPPQSGLGVEEPDTEPDATTDADEADTEAETDAEEVDASTEAEVAHADTEAEVADADAEMGHADTEAEEADADADTGADTEHEVAPVGDVEETDFGDVNPEGELADQFFSDGESEPPTGDEAEYAVPAAAMTVDYDQTDDGAKRRNWAGLVIGGILALGLAGIIYGLVTSGDDDDVATATSVTTTATTTDDGAATTATTTATTAATTATTVATTATTTATTATTTATTVATTATTATTVATTATTAATTATTTATTDDGAGSDDQSSLAPKADGPIPADEAGVQLLHGVPGVVADVYVNGQAIAAGFTSGSIAGPMNLDPGDYDVELFAAATPAAASSSDRSDTAVASGSLSIGADPMSIVAHLDDSGDVAVSTFAEDLTDLDPGRARVNVRHLMDVGTIDVLVDGEMLAPLDPGQEAAIEVDAGASTLVELVDDGGEIIASATVPVNDGELASLSAIGAPADSTAEIVIQRYSGLSTAPVAVPTGNSGLLDLGDDDTGIRTVYGMMIVLALSGIALMLRRRRHLS